MLSELFVPVECKFFVKSEFFFEILKKAAFFRTNKKSDTPLVTR